MILIKNNQDGRRDVGCGVHNIESVTIVPAEADAREFDSDTEFHMAALSTGTE